jgi:hypothetical protein
MRRGEDSRTGAVVFGGDGEFKHRGDYKRLSLGFYLRKISQTINKMKGRAITRSLIHRPSF